MKIVGKKMFNKIKLFTHYDLDGLGCAILAKAVFGEYLDIEIIDANKSSELVNNWLNSDISVYNTVMITDLSVNLDVANRLNKLSIKKVLCDHHETALELNNYFDWCKVIDDINHCGTNLFYGWLLSVCSPQVYNDILINYKKLVYEIHMYDNWLWVDADDQLANDLNILLRIIGKERFINRFLDDPSLNFGNDELALLQLEKEHINSYVFSRGLKSKRYDIELDGYTYKCAIVYGDQYVNELAHSMFEKYNDINTSIVINLPYTLSFRARNSETNLVPLTTYMGGGGHPASGGAPLELRLDEVTSLLFDKVNIKEVL